jgi:hypothetical protein
MIRTGHGLRRRRGSLSDPDFATAFLALKINKVQVVAAFVHKALFAALEAIGGVEICQLTGLGYGVYRGPRARRAPWMIVPSATMHTIKLH